MKPENFSVSLTAHDDNKTAKLEVFIEHHTPGQAREIGEMLLKLLAEEEDRYTLGD